MSSSSTLNDMYHALLGAFGHRGWWPGETPFEVMVGAVLTQNTNWQNVERAIANLRAAGMMSPAAIAAAQPADLQQLIRPAGYFRQKSVRLRRLAEWVAGFGADEGEAVCALRERSTEGLREELLSLKGIGPETADSILLYALHKPVFVVDAYTVRVLGRHGLIEPECTYYDVQAVLEDALARDVELHKDFHAQFVEVGKRFCRPRAPRCTDCPLLAVLGEPELDEEQAD